MNRPLLYSVHTLTLYAKDKIVFPILSYFFTNFLVQKRNPYNKDS